VAALTAGARAQDVAAGEQSFKKCLPCHSIGEGAKNKVGPVLNGLEGRHSGSIPEYSYSDANKNSGLTWDEATFKDYIKDPRAKIPNTKMIFPGIKNEKEAGDLWAYLNSSVRTARKSRLPAVTASRGGYGDDWLLSLVNVAGRTTDRM
jgi:cytochrome c